MAWGDYNNGGRTSTSEWRRIKQQAKHALPYQCAKCGTGEPLELDHIANQANTSNSNAKPDATTSATSSATGNT